MKKVQVIRSARKTLAIEIRTNEELIVRAPYFVDDSYIQKFLDDKEAWIQKNLQEMKKKQERIAELEPISYREIQELAMKAKEALPGKVSHYAQQLGVSCAKITIRNQTTRWGSCNSKGNLSFNCLLMLCPEEVQDYVVVHELCHRKEMNHSKKFWTLVESILPDYKTPKKWLKDHGGELIGRMKRG